MNAPLGYLTVRIGCHWFAMAVWDVCEVFRLKTVTPVPRAPSQVSGIVNLRGRVVTVIDLHDQLGLEAGPHAARLAVSIDDPAAPHALLVDGVGGVFDGGTVPGDVHPPGLDARWRAVSTGLAWLDGQLMPVLDAQGLCRPPPGDAGRPAAPGAPARVTGAAC